MLNLSFVHLKLQSPVLVIWHTHQKWHANDQVSQCIFKCKFQSVKMPTINLPFQINNCGNPKSITDWVDSHLPPGIQPSISSILIMLVCSSELTTAQMKCMGVRVALMFSRYQCPGEVWFPYPDNLSFRNHPLLSILPRPFLPRHQQHERSLD